MIKLVLIVKYCISSTLTVNSFLLSFSILYPLLVSVPALSVVKYCISSKLHQIHYSLACFNDKILYFQYIDSVQLFPVFQQYYPLLVSVQAFISCIYITLTVNALYHLFVVATELYQQCSIFLTVLASTL